MDATCANSTRSEDGRRNSVPQRKRALIGPIFLLLGLILTIFAFVAESAPLNRQQTGEGLLSVHHPLGSTGSSSLPTSMERKEPGTDDEEIPRILVGEHVPETVLKAPRACPDFTQFVVGSGLTELVSV
jgi:hypothetical protein